MRGLILGLHPANERLSYFVTVPSHWLGASLESALSITSCFLQNTFHTLSSRQNGCRFADDSFKCIFLNENVWIAIKISLNFIPKGPINSISALVQIMVWRRPGDKPLSEPMMISLLMHICATRPQWVWVDTPVHPLVPSCFTYE